MQSLSAFHGMGVTRACGMSLIEVLVALLVVALGMMGVASLILQSLRAGYVALTQTQAVNLVSDIEERIRANPNGGSAYHCAMYMGGPVERGCAPDAGKGAGSNCTASELAEDDLARWQNAVRIALPAVGSDACAANVEALGVGAGGAEVFRISLGWQPPGAPAPSSYVSDLLLALPR